MLMLTHTGCLFFLFLNKIFNKEQSVLHEHQDSSSLNRTAQILSQLTIVLFSTQCMNDSPHGSHSPSPSPLRLGRVCQYRNCLNVERHGHSVCHFIFFYGALSLIDFQVTWLSYIHFFVTVFPFPLYSPICMTPWSSFFVPSQFSCFLMKLLCHG